MPGYGRGPFHNGFNGFVERWVLGEGVVLGTRLVFVGGNGLGWEGRWVVFVGRLRELVWGDCCVCWENHN